MTNEERGNALLNINQLVVNARRVLVTSHTGPDGDSIGSCLALQAALHQIGKEAVIWMADPVPAALGFLEGVDEIQQGGTPPAVDLVFALDMSDLDRCGLADPKAALGGAPIINIDHHLSNSQFGCVNLVDPEAAATCQVLVDVVRAIGARIDAKLATLLLAGIISDTLGFRTANTTVTTIRLAAELMEAGAPLAEVVDAVFKNMTIPQLKLWGLALGALQTRCDRRIVWTVVDQAMLDAAEATMDLVEGMINLMVSAAEIDAAVVFKRERGGTKVSMRTSARINAAAICRIYGGGGHARAAGCTLEPGSLAREQELLDQIERELLAFEAAANEACGVGSI